MGRASSAGIAPGQGCGPSEDRDVDLNAHPDWHPDNVRWHGRRLIAVHDWDSVVCQPESAIAGAAAASFLGIDDPRAMANVADSAAFLDA